MQYHLEGYTYGDPIIQTPAPGRTEDQGPLPAHVDVLIVGTGPAGAVLAAQLSQFPGITTRVVERRQSALQRGHADGVACRTVEMFNAFDLSSRLLDEAYWVNETTFWAPNPQNSAEIERTDTIQDVADGLSEFPHVIVNQARMQELLFDHAARSAARLQVDYGYHYVSQTTDLDQPYPVTVTLAETDEENRPTGETRTVRARYVVGCDGARSAVRESIGRSLQGDAQNHAWGVLDVLVDTDFPDIRKKSVIRSEQGSIIIIPREGGHLVRLYVDLGTVDPTDTEFRTRTSVDDVISAANRIMSPYTVSVAHVAWWSVYEVGQRLADGFDDVDGRSEDAPRIFIAGDACHTHSAKAGQGMNVSMQDTFNLGWKLAAVLQGRAPAELLHTYSQERQVTAAELIDYDTKWSKMVGSRTAATTSEDAVSASDVQRQFVDGGTFTAGFATHYQPALLTGGTEHQHLAQGYPVGQRFHSAPVVRVADARPLQLGHVHDADGRFRIYLFADRDGLAPESAAARWCQRFDTDQASALNRFTPDDAERDSVFDVRAIVQQPHLDVDPTALPDILRPRKGPYQVVDHEKVFSAESTNGFLLGDIPGLNVTEDIYSLRDIDRDAGAVVVVRPDQYVAQVLPLDDESALNDYFAGFLLEQD
ncbi:MAG: FAD-dependent monooxygenase [Micrococcaceae bacterium]